jgi:hypothetical protein
MKTVTFTVAALCAVVALPAFAAQRGSDNELRPVEMALQPQNVFIPPGFDSNDNAQIVVSGELPNSCYQAAGATATVDKKNKKIIVKQDGYRNNGAFCVEMISSYTSTVNVGVLDAAKYEVLIAPQGKSAPQTRGTMNITAADRPEKDEVIYAPVDEVTYTQKADGSELVLRGTFRSECANLDRVEVLTRAPGVVEVLPITDLREGVQCVPGSKPFDATVSLANVPKGTTLVHVRSQSGQSINRVIEI